MGEFCDKCHEYLMYPERHKCQLFEVCFFENGPDEWTEVWGTPDYDGGWGDIAAKAAERDDVNSADYCIINAGGAKAFVRKDGEQKEYCVNAEIVAKYTARPA